MKQAKSWVAGSSFRFGYRAMEALVTHTTDQLRCWENTGKLHKYGNQADFFRQLTFIKDPPSPQHYEVTCLQPLLLIYLVNTFSMVLRTICVLKSRGECELQIPQQHLGAPFQPWPNQPRSAPRCRERDQLSRNECQPSELWQYKQV